MEHGPPTRILVLTEHFCNMNGDDEADAILVNDDDVVVRLSTGQVLEPNRFWTTNPYFRSHGTFLRT